MSGGHGRHWHCLYADIDTFVDGELPELVRSLEVIAEADLPPDDDGPARRLFYMCEEDGDIRHLLVGAAEADGGPNTLLSAYPFCCTGIEHNVALTAIMPRAGGVEALLSGTIAGTGRVTFFDPLYALNRDAYEVGRTLPFRFAAIAYDVQPPDRDHLEIADPERSREVRRMVRAAGGSVGAGDGPLLLDLHGAAMMFPIENWGDDDYSFYAPVKEVSACHLGGRELVELQITPLRLEARDYDILLYAAAHRFAEGFTATAGGDAMGAFWLQGHLAD